GTPVNYQTPDSAWHAINDTIVPITGASGFQQAAGSLPITFGPNADSQNLVTVGSGDNRVSFGLQGAASSLGIASGNTLLYNNVFPATDLQYNLGRDELKELLVVRQAPGASQGLTYSFPITLPRNNQTSVVEESNGDYEITLNFSDNRPPTVLTIP